MEQASLYLPDSPLLPQYWRPMTYRWRTIRLTRPMNKTIAVVYDQDRKVHSVCADSMVDAVSNAKRWIDQHPV